MSDIEKLGSALTFESETMMRINCEIKGRAFFPGGKGILDGSNEISNKPIMVLGQDFDTYTNYQQSIKRGNEENPTWRNLFKLLRASATDEKSCFYTNAIMGARKSKSNSGKSPAFKDRMYIKKCQDFFLYQLELQKPKLILVLGLRTAEFLHGTSSQLEPWKTIANFKAIDNEGKQVLKDVTFNNKIKSNLVLLMHPSSRPWNIASRTFRGEKGENAQLRMIREAIS